MASPPGPGAASSCGQCRGLEAARAALALMVAENSRTGDSQAVILGDVPAADVLGAQSAIMGAWLRGVLGYGQSGEDASSSVATFLRDLALRIAEESAR